MRRSLRRATFAKSSAPSNAPRGRLGALRTLFSREYEDRVAVAGVTMSLARGRTGRLHRPQRRRQVDHDQDADRHPGADVGKSAKSPGSCRTSTARRTRRNIGVVFGQRSQLYWDLPLVESFELLRAIYGDSTRPLPAEPQANSSTCSRWTTSCARRCASFRSDSACAAILRPRCCTIPRSSTSTSRRSGSTSSRRKRSAVYRRASTPSAERPIILTTHDLADVERLCRRIVLIDRGTIIYDGDIERIKSEYGRYRTLVLRFGQAVETRSSTAPSSTSVDRDDGALPLRPQRRAPGSAHPAGQRPVQRRGRDHRGAGTRVDHPPNLRRRIRRARSGER